MTSIRKMSLGRKLMFTMIATALIVVAVVGYVMWREANNNTEIAGLTTARAISNQVVTLRGFYTAEVVRPAKAAGMEVNYDFAEKEQTIPLPATMVKALGAEIRKAYPGTDVKLYSNYPFRHKPAEQKDEFERAAIDALENNPQTPFYKLEEFDGRLTMRYAVADVMRESCIDCHNTHPESPKTDWRIGDVRGVVEVMVPVEEAKSQLYAASLMQWLVVAVGFVLIVLLTGLVLRRITTALRRTIHTLSTTSEQIAVTVETNERVASDQAAAMHQTTVTMEQLGTSSQVLSDQAETGANETTHSLDLTESGAKSVQESLDAMSELKVKVTGLAQEIMSLSDSIDKIGEISSFVGDLSKQTNMLAMNAAVEAAHAGEHGKGFAVVATEIRKLADQSGQSVSRINDLVAKIHEATNASVMATDVGTKMVDEAMGLTGQTGDVFNDLGNSARRAAESVQQISLNNKQQAQAIHQVVQSVESLNSGTQEAADGFKFTSEGLQALNRAMSNLQTLIGITNNHSG